MRSLLDSRAPIPQWIDKVEVSRIGRDRSVAIRVSGQAMSGAEPLSKRQVRETSQLGSRPYSFVSGWAMARTWMACSDE